MDPSWSSEYDQLFLTGPNGRRIVALLNLMTEKVNVSEALRLREPNMPENIQISHVYSYTRNSYNTINTTA
jgi:hypothetical protein